MRANTDLVQLLILDGSNGTVNLRNGILSNRRLSNRRRNRATEGRRRVVYCFEDTEKRIDMSGQMKNILFQDGSCNFRDTQALSRGMYGSLQGICCYDCTYIFHRRQDTKHFGAKMDRQKLIHKKMIVLCTKKILCALPTSICTPLSEHCMLWR